MVSISVVNVPFDFLISHHGFLMDSARGREEPCCLCEKLRAAVFVCGVVVAAFFVTFVVIVEFVCGVSRPGIEPAQLQQRVSALRTELEHDRLRTDEFYHFAHLNARPLANVRGANEVAIAEDGRVPEVQHHAAASAAAAMHGAAERSRKKRSAHPA